jgi:hypothetical protein
MVAQGGIFSTQILELELLGLSFYIALLGEA